MKFRAMFVIFTFIVMTISHAQIKESLVVYFDFEERVGKTVNDLSGNNNHGKLEGDTNWTEGNFGKAVKFGGKNGIVRVEHSKDFEFVDGITITAWIRPTLKAGPGTWQLIAAKGRDVHEFFEILLHPTGFIWMGWKLTGGRAVPDKSPLDVKKNVWQHIAVSYQSGKWWTTYLNGEVLIDYPKKNDKLIPLDAPLFLGVEEPLGMNRYYNGDTDDFAIFNCGLSQDEIKQVQAGMGKIMAIQPQAKLHTAWVRLKTKYLQ